MHVCGGYFFNSLVKILEKEYSYSNLKVVHRLDKHTSGVVIFAKTSLAANNFRESLHTDSVKKAYYCRVRGDFDESTNYCDLPITCLNRNKGIYGCVKGEVNIGEDEPKSAYTTFEKQFYEEKSNTSVVIARPKTGRTHQIRLHLQALNFPIANDPCYGGEFYNDLGVDDKFVKKDEEDNGLLVNSEQLHVLQNLAARFRVQIPGKCGGNKHT